MVELQDHQGKEEVVVAVQVLQAKEGAVGLLEKVVEVEPHQHQALVGVEVWHLAKVVEEEQTHQAKEEGEEAYQFVQEVEVGVEDHQYP